MSLSAVFNPQSIAIIGASSREKTVGNDVVKNLVEYGFEGDIFPINPKTDQLYGLKVYADISQVERQVDLIVVAIPAPAVPGVLKQAAAKGARAAVVISAGFKEIGRADLEQELVEVCAQHDMTLVGPNCLGAINPAIKMSASFGQLMPKLGDVAFVSQSGALCTAVLDYARQLDVGFSKFISIGNKAGIDELDLIKYFAHDPQTKVILMYVEELKQAQDFIKASKQLNASSQPKPIIVLKSGKTEAGASAIVSHTGSLAGGDIAYQALFDQAGMIRADNIKELFSLAQVFSRNSLQPAAQAAIVTNAGGPGVLTTDEAVAHGLELAKLSPQTSAQLKQILPEAASINNPIDVLGDAKADRYQQVLELLAQDKQVDSVVVVLTPQSMTQVQATAQAVIDFKNQTNKPIVASFMGKPSIQQGLNLLNQAQVATTAYPEPAAKSMARLAEFFHQVQHPSSEVLQYNDVEQDKVKQIFNQAQAQGRTEFPEAQALEVIKAYGLPVLASQIVATPEKAGQVANQIAGPVALKIVSDDILHKTEAGGVMLDVSPEQAPQKFKELIGQVKSKKPNAKLDGVLVMEMAPANGTELILGAHFAPGLGSLVMFGLGGIYVEVLKDVSFAFSPLTRADAKRMMKQLKISQLLDGVRGQQARDKEALIECIGRVSQLVADFPQIKELDINPLLALPTGAKVLDARIALKNSL